MPDPPIRILVVEDDEDDFLITRDLLRAVKDTRYELEWISTFEAALKRIASGSFDIYLVDYRLGAQDGLEFLRRAKAAGCRIPMILLTGLGDREIDMRAMGAGAADFLVKGQIVPELLERSIRYAIEQQRHLEALHTKATQLEQAYRQLRESQAQLLQTAKMASIGQLAAGIAHEINNPVGVILGFAQHALKRLPSQDSPLAFPLVSIEREALRCKTFVQNLLTFSRRKSDAADFLDLRTAVHDALALLEAHARPKGIKVRLDLPESPLWIIGQPDQIQQIVINLGNNAIDAMPQGGILSLRAEPRVEQGTRFARIEITDTGMGIPPDMRDRVFEPFFTTKDPGQGVGLGLSICYEIVQRLHGRIAFESEAGRGTRFWILIPEAPLLAQGSARSAEDRPTDASAGLAGTRED